MIGPNVSSMVWLSGPAYEVCIIHGMNKVTSADEKRRHRICNSSQGREQGSNKMERHWLPLPGLLHFTLDPYLIMLRVKQGGIKYHFLSLWYDSAWD